VRLWLNLISENRLSAFNNGSVYLTISRSAR